MIGRVVNERNQFDRLLDVKRLKNTIVSACRLMLFLNASSDENRRCHFVTKLDVFSLRSSEYRLLSTIQLTVSAFCAIADVADVIADDGIHPVSISLT